MGATFSKIKTWVAEVLYCADLNAEFDNIIDNLTPAGIDDESTNAAAMQATTDPYAGAVISLPTSLQGELQRLRYLIAQITGETYWYIDPDASIATIYAAIGSGSGKVMRGDGGTTKAYFYQNTAPTAWTLDSTPADALLAVKGGSNAFNANGGTKAGTWTQPNHTHTTGDFTLTTGEIPAHDHGSAGAHTHTFEGSGSGSGAVSSITYTTNLETKVSNVSGLINNASDHTHTSVGSGTAHNHGTSGNGATAATWRPLAQLGIICTLDA